MKIYFVRHGHPDYANDCLTELGKRQAKAAAERLSGKGIERVYSSTKGRALETAEHTARRLGLEVIPCDFMREIGWASIDGEPILANGHPWRLSEALAAQGRDLTDPLWTEKEPFSKSRLVACCDTVARGLDAWLETLGYRREGNYYRVLGGGPGTVAMFSHGGSSIAAMAHLFNIPFPLLIGLHPIGFTGITAVSLSDGAGELVFPKLLSSDAEHIAGLEAELVFNN